MKRLLMIALKNRFEMEKEDAIALQKLLKKFLMVKMK